MIDAAFQAKVHSLSDRHYMYNTFVYNGSLNIYLVTGSFMADC